MSDSLSTKVNTKNLPSPKQNILKSKNPSLHCRATPVTLYSNKELPVTGNRRVNTEVVELKKLYNPYEYYFNAKRKIEYLEN